MNYQKLTIVGNVTADPKQATSKKGNTTYTTFSVGVGEGKEGTVFFPVAAFGKVGENVASFVGKGREVLVEGRVRVSEKGRFGVVADRVVFGSSPKETKQESEEEQ
jgi:single-strand DNA-binding protein